MANKVIFYAGLKDYFKEPVELFLTPKNTFNDVSKFLCTINPEANDLLKISRYACKDVFVNNEDTIEPGTEICVLPPASGG